MKRLLTDKEAAEYLGIGRSTLWRLAKAKKLHPIKQTRRCTRFDIQDLEAYVETLKES